MSQERINEMNSSVYGRQEIVQYYAQPTTLQPAETTILNSIHADIAGQNILDIGVGAGRTIPFLSALSPAHYVGVDYSREMVEVCRQRYPGADIRQADARNLSDFAEASFDLAFFSYNGIDSVNHQGRLQILREMARILKPGGYCVFSSHNRLREGFAENKMVLAPFRYHFNAEFKGRLRTLPFPRKIRFILGTFWRALKGFGNHLKNRRHEVHQADYCIVNDYGHNFTLLLYYVSPTEQKKQLRECGFQNPVTVYDHDGNIVDGDMIKSAWLYYLVRK